MTKPIAATSLIAMSLLLHAQNIWAAPKCDLVVEPKLQEIIESRVFTNEEERCQNAIVEARKDCVNDGFQNCQLVPNQEDPRRKCTSKTNVFSPTSHIATFKGEKVKSRLKTAEEIKGEKCQKIGTCESQYLNDETISLLQMEKLMLLKREYGC